MRFPSLVPTLALFAAMAVTATLLWRGGATPGLPIEAVPAANPRASDAEPAAAMSIDPAEDGDAAFDATDPGSARTEVAADPPIDSSTGPLVIVVGGAPPTPVAGVEVAWVLSERAQQQRSRLRPDAAMLIDDVDLPHRFGQKARTNARGELQLPPLEGMTLLAVRDGSDFAAAAAKPGQQKVRMQLVADETLQIAVVDEHGHNRKDVPLAVFVNAGKGHDSIWNGSTDAHGRAVVRHFQLVRPGQKRGEPFAAAATVPVVEVAMAFQEFSARPAPTEPVTIVLPATVPLEVTLQHRSGAPILAPLRIRLDAARNSDTKFVPVPRDFDQLRDRKPLGALPLRFPHSGAGLRLQPSVEVDGARKPLPMLPFATPAGLDAPTEVTLTLPDSCLVLAARLLAADGQPLDGRSVSYLLRADLNVLAAGAMVTLASGVCDLVAATPPAGAAVHLVLRDTDDQGAVTGCTVELATLLAGERRDLGALRLQPQPLLARGTVRDDRGLPIDGARIQIERQLTTGRGERWRGEPMLDARTGIDGAFAIFGALPRGPFRARADAKDHFPEVTDLLSPGAQLDLRLSRVGICKGRILLPAWLPQSAAQVSLQRSDQQGRARAAAVRHQRGYFWLSGIEPGVYTATVSARNLPEPLATIANVRIDPGENEDPRLSPLDLQTALFRYRLRAIGPGGRELRDLDGPILWRTARPSGEQAVVGFRWQKGKAELIAPVPFAEFTTLGKGYPPTTLSLAAGDHDVYLQPLQPFIAVLPGVRGACGPARAIRVSTIFTGDTGLPQGLSGQDQRSGDGFSFPRWELGKSGGGWLDPFDRAEIVLSRGGPHEVVLRIYADEKQDGRQVSIGLGTVDVVVDGSQSRPVVIAVDPQKLEAALRSLEPATQDPGDRGRPR